VGRCNDAAGAYPQPAVRALFSYNFVGSEFQGKLTKMLNQLRIEPVPRSFDPAWDSYRSSRRRTVRRQSCLRWQQELVLKNSHVFPSSGMAAPRVVEGVVARPDIQRQAVLTGSRVITTARDARSTCFDRDVLRQPVEIVGPIPVDRLPTVVALLRESSESRGAQRQPARASASRSTAALGWGCLTSSRCGSCWPAVRLHDHGRAWNTRLRDFVTSHNVRG